MARMDSRQLSELYEGSATQLKLYARQWLSASQSEDTVQEAFMRLMRQTFKPREPKAWLFRVVRSLAISHLRKRQRRNRHNEELADQQDGWFQSDADTAVDASTAEHALSGLPIEQREVVVMRIWGNLALKDIAAVVSAPISTVHSRYQAALAALRKELQPCSTK